MSISLNETECLISIIRISESIQRWNVIMAAAGKNYNHLPLSNKCELGGKLSFTGSAGIKPSARVIIQAANINSIQILPKSLIPPGKYTGSCFCRGLYSDNVSALLYGTVPKSGQFFQQCAIGFTDRVGWGMIFLVNVMLFPSNSILWHARPSLSLGEATFHNILPHIIPPYHPSTTAG